MAEMVEVAYVLRSVSEQVRGRGCLVVLDELGRGTSFEEGLALCIAVCEELAKSKVSFEQNSHQLSGIKKKI